jgi:hypothetical protein
VRLVGAAVEKQCRTTDKLKSEISCYLLLYKSITHFGGSGSPEKSRFMPLLFDQRKNHVGPYLLT